MLPNRKQRCFSTRKRLATAEIGLRAFGGEEALLFEKRSKNFCYWGARWLISSYLKVQKFFGSFFQKRTASLLNATPPDGSVGAVPALALVDRRRRAGREPAMPNGATGWTVSVSRGTDIAVRSFLARRGIAGNTW